MILFRRSRQPLWAFLVCIFNTIKDMLDDSNIKVRVNLLPMSPMSNRFVELADELSEFVRVDTLFHDLYQS